MRNASKHRRTHHQSSHLLCDTRARTRAHYVMGIVCSYIAKRRQRRRRRPINRIQVHDDDDDAECFRCVHVRNAMNACSLARRVRRVERNPFLWMRCAHKRVLMMYYKLENILTYLLAPLGRLHARDRRTDSYRISNPLTCQCGGLCTWLH